MFTVHIVKFSATLISIHHYICSIFELIITPGIKKWRTPSNVLLANLATADLIVNVWTFPITLASIVQGDRAGSATFCKVRFIVWSEWVIIEEILFVVTLELFCYIRAVLISSANTFTDL